MELCQEEITFMEQILLIIYNKQKDLIVFEQNEFYFSGVRYIMIGKEFFNDRGYHKI